jgi:hypothetical protein
LAIRQVCRYKRRLLLGVISHILSVLFFPFAIFEKVILLDDFGINLQSLQHVNNKTAPTDAPKIQRFQQGMPPLIKSIQTPS